MVMETIGPIVLITAFGQILAVVFFLSGVTKVFDRHSTIQSVVAFAGRGGRSGVLLSWVVPLGKFLLALGLSIDHFQVIAVFPATAALFAFTLLQIYALAKGLRVPCGCFGFASTELVSIWTALRNVAMLAICIAIIVYWASFSRLAGNQQLGLGQSSFIRASTTLIMLYYLSLQQVLQNFYVGAGTRSTGLVLHPTR